jgi:ABC-type proline/glycine betaine transport system permease subunit
MELPTLPLAAWIGAVVHWMQFNLDGVFGAIKAALLMADLALRGLLGAVPPWGLIGGIALILLWRRRFGAAVAITAALALIANLGLWRAATDTVALVLVAAALALGVGAPLGILVAESRVARAFVTPVLDYMQTTPAFVYLIPAVLFFGIGAAPGVLATAAFALPPVTRALALGLDQVSSQLIEAGHAFGGSRLQILFKIKLPLALPYFRVGVNQCIMMSLSMVVVCALIGARGLGVEVVTALTQMNLAQGIEAGLAVVLVAATLDRLFDPGSSRKLS